MTRDRQDESKQRDTTMARLVAAALESQTAKPTGDTCPDAGLLAAYADHALGADETARWENHFADCARCQEVLAVLTVSAEDPLTQQEVARLSQSVSKIATPDESAVSAPQAETPTARPQIVRPVEHRAPWRWLVPAFGVAVAVAMWFALRPAPPSIAPGTQIMAEKTTVPPPPGQQAQIPQTSVTLEPATPSPATPLAAGNAPTPAPTENKETPSLDRETFSSAANAPAEQKERLRDEASNETGGRSTPNQDKNAASNAPATEAARTTPAAPPAASQQTQTVTAARAAPAVRAGNADVVGGAGAATPSAALQAARQAPAPLQTPLSGGQLSADNTVKSLPLANRNIAAMAKVSAAPIVFGTPDRGVQWRISVGGRIERSTDQGKSWQPQASGVTSELLAGATVSNKIAWIVGRADVILRTTDGEHWQRTTTPPMPPLSSGAGGSVDAIASSPDWSAIQSSDALHAIITSADGRRYATTDGGRTWIPEP